MTSGQKETTRSATGAVGGTVEEVMRATSMDFTCRRVELTDVLRQPVGSTSRAVSKYRYFDL